MEYNAILFDGVCNLCNRTVTFVIKRDKKDRFRFAALQSEAGEILSKKAQIPLSENKNDLSTIILVEKDKYYTKSTAALRIARRLSGGWPLLYGFIIIPPFIRNAVYDFIARNRYRWFGRQDSCMVPTGELMEKFL